MGNTDADFSHVTQTGFFFTINGSERSTVVFAGDRWADFAGNGIGFNQWMPISFDGTNPVLNSLNEWRLDVVTGNWSVDSGNNYALSPSFEADRVNMTEPAGWKTSTSSGGAPFGNRSGGHTGNWNWTLSDTSNYQASLDQTATALPNGTYQLSVWVMSTGAQPSAQVYARSVGGELTAPINSRMNAWTEVFVPGIVVSNGQLQFGATTTANANQSLSFDDFRLVRVGP